jgi:sporulation protein YlmC with PRC-barrel domain
VANIGGIREHMEVIGADGVHVGTIDKVEGDRLKLTKADSGQGRHQGHHHYISTGLVAEVEGNKVRLSATGANAFMFQEEEDHGSAHLIAGRRTSRRREGKGPAINRNEIALGVAVLATAAGAAFLTRRKQPSSDGFELRMQTDEDVRLISSSKVEGTAVYGAKGEHLGRIENFMVDKYSGRVAYAVLSFGGTLGFGASLFPLPWSYLTYDVEKDGYQLGLTKEQLAKAPRFAASDAPEFSADYRRSIASAYDGSSY